MKNEQRIAIFILCAMLASLASCGTSDVKIPEDSVSIANDSNNLSADTTRREPVLPQKDYNGAEFTFLGTGAGKHSGYYVTDDIDTDSENGEIFNDAIYRRNRTVEEKYNVKILLLPSDDIVNDINKAVIAGDSVYDAVFGFQYDLYNLALAGSLLDLNTLGDMDLSSEWWDKNILDNFRLAGKNFVVTGDISTKDDACTRLTIFNKKLVDEYSLENPYELVASGKWTLEYFSKMVRGVSRDVNGNSRMEAGDVFGLIDEYALPNILFFGAEGRYVEDSGKGSFDVVIDDEKNFDRLIKIFDLLSDQSSISYINPWKDLGGYSNPYTYARSLFTQDKYLFHISAPLTFVEFRDMESEFGIVPLPKYDETQDRYFCPVDREAPMLSVPINPPDSEKTGIILEAMAAESMATITPAYNETLLKRKYTRDNESAEMLDIIAASRTYTIEAVANWGGIVNIASAKHADKQEIKISDFESVIVSVQTEIEKAMANFNK